MRGGESSFWSQAPFARLLLPLVAGMCVPDMKSGADILTGAALSGLCLYYFIPSFRLSWRWRKVPLWMIIILYAVLGNERMTAARQNVEMPENYQGEEIWCCVGVLEPPVDKPHSRQCAVRILQCASEPAFVRRKAVLYLAPGDESDSLLPSDRIWIHTSLEDFENFTEDFDYHSYMKNKGYTARAYVRNSQWRKMNAGETLRGSCRTPGAKALLYRELWVERYRYYGIENENLALISALSLGKKDGLDAALRDRFASAGVSHILAVSGMHVGIVYLFVDKILALFFMILGRGTARFGMSADRRRGIQQTAERFRRLGVVAVLWMYAFLTGLSPSVIRSVTMFSLSSAAFCLGRRTTSWNSLCVTAFLMLCVRPLFLFDLSFQMSFAAVASILIFLPPFQHACRLPLADAELPEILAAAPVAERLPGLVPFRRRMLQILTGLKNYFLTLMLMSLAAQMGTAPLSLRYFHQFPNYFLLGNLLLVPLAVGLTYGALAFLCLSLLPSAVFGGFCRISAFLLCQGLDFFRKYAAWVDGIPGACEENLLFSLAGVLELYAVLCLLFVLFRNRRYHYELERSENSLKSRWRHRRNVRTWGQKPKSQ